MCYPGHFGIFEGHINVTNCNYFTATEFFVYLLCHRWHVFLWFLVVTQNVLIKSAFYRIFVSIWMYRSGRVNIVKFLAHFLLWKETLLWSAVIAATCWSTHAVIVNHIPIQDQLILCHNLCNQPRKISCFPDSHPDLCHTLSSILSAFTCSMLYLQFNGCVKILLLCTFLDAFIYCLPNSAKLVMLRMKNTPNVLKMHFRIIA